MSWPRQTSLLLILLLASGAGCASFPEKRIASDNAGVEMAIRPPSALPVEPATEEVVPPPAQPIPTFTEGSSNELWRRKRLLDLPSLGRDVKSLANWENAAILLGGAAASIAVRETIDDDVDDWTAETPHRWGDGNDFFSIIGNPGHHFAAAGLLYGTSLYTQDPELHELSTTMMNALILTNGSTLLLKLAANTEAPNGESLAWPSGHTSSSVAMAAVLDEYYGPGVGLPAYALAGLVAWSRIDDREHDLSDVVFGAALGYVIGKTVARHHRAEFAGMRLAPQIDPLTGTSGLGLEKRY